MTIAIHPELDRLTEATPANRFIYSAPPPPQTHPPGANAAHELSSQGRRFAKTLCSARVAKSDLATAR
jgi:hypothetical protein